jgi:hypothetical protein
MRIRSDEIRNNSKFIIAAVVINHLLSAFNAGKKVAAYNRSLAAAEGWSLQFFALGNTQEQRDITLQVSTRF